MVTTLDYGVKWSTVIAAISYVLKLSTETVSRRGIIRYMTDQQQEEEAKALLGRLGTERKELEARLDDLQKETHDAIVDILMARTLGPSEVARQVQYDRQHVARIAKKAGVPPLREATVVSRAKAVVPKESSPAVAVPRRQVTQALRKPAPSISPKVMALPRERIRELVDLAQDHYPDWVDEIEREYPQLRGPDLDLVIVELGHQKGFKIPELAERPDRPVTEEEAAGFAALARSKADAMQLKKLNQDAANAPDGSKNITVMHAALDMELLTHDEVYGPATGEETSG